MAVKASKPGSIYAQEDRAPDNTVTSYYQCQSGERHSLTSLTHSVYPYVQNHTPMSVRKHTHPAHTLHNS